MQKLLNHQVLVRLLGSKKYQQRPKDLVIGKERILSNQKFGLMLRGAAVRGNAEEFVQNLSDATSRTTHPEYLYASLYSTMTTAWIEKFNANQVYVTLDNLVQLKFNCSELVVTSSMTQSLYTKKKIDDHVAEQRRVVCRLFNRVLAFNTSEKGSIRGSPLTTIRGLGMMAQCSLKWEHIVAYLQQYSASPIKDNSTILNPLNVIVSHLSCAELREFLQALQLLNINWTDLSSELQTEITGTVAQLAESFTSIQAVDVVFVLSQMGCSLVELESQKSFCSALFKIMKTALLDGAEIHHSSNADHILASIASMKMTYVQLPLTMNRAIDMAVNGMDQTRLENMANILSVLQLDLKRLEPQVVAVIQEYEAHHVEQPDQSTLRPTTVFSKTLSSSDSAEEAAISAEVTGTIENSTTIPSDSTTKGFGLSSLFTSEPNEEEDTVYEIEDLIHKELATAYRSGDDKQFIESLKAVLEEVDLNAPTRQKYFSNELLFLRYLNMEWIRRVKVELIPDLMECLVLMQCGFNMIEKKFVWTVITRFINDRPQDFTSETDKDLLIFMSFLESISTHFNQHEVLNAFKVLSTGKLNWSCVPQTTKAALLRTMQRNAGQIAPKDAALLIDCLSSIAFDVETLRDGSASPNPNELQSCHQIIGGIVANALRAFQTDLRFVIGGHKAAAEVLNHVALIHFSYGLMDDTLVELINAHLAAVCKRGQLSSLQETLSNLGKMNFQFDNTKARMLPILFGPFVSGSDNTSVLLNSTLDALSILKIEFDSLPPQYQQLLLQRVKSSVGSGTHENMPELMKRLQSVNMSLPDPVVDDMAPVIAV